MTSILSFGATVSQRPQLLQAHRVQRPACRQHRLTVRAERSYVMVKPDGVQRGLIGEIIGRFERKGFQLVGLKMFQTPKDVAEQHYKDLSSKPFYGALVDYIVSGPVVCIVRSPRLWLPWPWAAAACACRNVVDAAQAAHAACLRTHPRLSCGRGCRPRLRPEITHICAPLSGCKARQFGTIARADSARQTVRCALPHRARSSLLAPRLQALEGDGVVAAARKLIGATNPLEAEPGTIRGDLAVQVGRNVVHGSDSPENGERELALWFDEGQLVSWDAHMAPWLTEGN
jgi:nucleoside diphosphate kinase